MLFCDNSNVYSNVYILKCQVGVPHTVGSVDLNTEEGFFFLLQSHKVSSKSDQKQKIFITRTFFVNKQLTLFFNYLKKYSLNFAQNFRECSFNLAGSESGEKSRRAQFFVYISQLFVYKTRLWT